MTPAVIKPKTCACCGTSFTPQRPMARACSVPCAMTIGRAKTAAKAAKVEKAQDKVTRRSLETIPELLKAAQREFNKWVRTRDEKEPCISCGKPPGDLTQLHAGRDAGHYRSVGSAGHLRFHADNVHAQCVRCNQWNAGNAVDYRLGLVARLGPERVDALERANAVQKWTHDDLRDIRETYRNLTKQLKKEQK